MASASCNTWGCEVAPDNEIFFSTATCGEPINHVVIPERIRARGSLPGLKSYLDIMEENKVYPPYQETREPYVQIDWVGQFTAAAGACIYDGGAWPEKWEPDNAYSFFVTEPTVHLLHHEFLSPRGPTYRGHKEEGRKETEFLTSSDYRFRPIHSRVGPTARSTWSIFTIKSRCITTPAGLPTARTTPPPAPTATIISHAFIACSTRTPKPCRRRTLTPPIPRRSSPCFATPPARGRVTANRLTENPALLTAAGTPWASWSRTKPRRPSAA